MNPLSSRTAAVASVVILFSILAAINAAYFPLPFPDEAEYWTLASNIAQTGTFSYDGKTPSAYRPPLVAWILTPLAASGMPMAAARPIFMIFFSATGILAGYFLCRLFRDSRLVPPLGTAFVLSHPLYFFSAGNLYPQQVLTPLLLGALVLACQKPTTSRSVIVRSAALGAITGASLLASAPALFSLVPVLLLLAWEDWTAVRHGQFSKAYRSAIAALVIVLCVAPWLARNSRNIHPGLYLSLNSGINLLFGNSPNATPTSGVNVDLSEYTPVQANESEFDANRSLTRAAIANIRENPGYYAQFYLKKLLAGFSNVVDTVTHGPNKTATFAKQGYMAAVWLGVGVLAFFIVLRGTTRAGVQAIDWELAKISFILALAAYLISVAGYAVFFTRLRFRIPVDVALALISAVGWGSLRTVVTRQKI